MTKHILMAIGVALIIPLGGGRVRAQVEPGAEPADSTVELAALVSEALERNPDLVSAYNRWRASEATIPQAGALPDPTLTFGLLNLPVTTFAFDSEPMTGKQISLMQMFPFPGKLGLKEKIAVEGSQVSRESYEELRNQLVKDVSLAYYDLFYLDRAIEITEKNTSLVADFVRIAESKYSVGKGLQQDVLKAQVQLSKMTDKLITLRQQREKVEARLNALLDRPADAPVGKPLVPVADPLPEQLDRLEELAEENRPLLRAWRATVRQSEHRERLAKKGYYPDFKVGVAYTFREVLQSGMGGVDYFSGLVSINVPLYFWRKQSKQVEETRFATAAVDNRYREMRNRVFSALDAKVSELRKNYRLMDLFETGIIPQATQSLNSAISGYQTDKVDFLTMLNNEITLFDYELDYYRSLSDYQKNIAELEALVGTSFESRE